MTDEFKIPDKINVDELKNLIHNFEGEKEKRVNEVLQRLRIPPTPTNLEKASKLVDRRVESGELNPDYTLNADTTSTSVGTSGNLQSIQASSRAGFVQNINNLLNNMLRGRNKQNLIDKAIDGIMSNELSGFAVVNPETNEILNIEIDYVLDCLADYKQDHQIPRKLEPLLLKLAEQLTSDEEVLIADYFINNNEFSIYVVEKFKEENT